MTGTLSERFEWRDGVPFMLIIGDWLDLDNEWRAWQAATARAAKVAKEQSINACWTEGDSEYDIAEKVQDQTRKQIVAAIRGGE
jgi:hypothetical protein